VTTATATATESFAPVHGAELYCREVGEGRPLVVIHGGPDFDHTYLLPDMDRLAASRRLVYYDQRGRGRSRGELRPEDIHIDRYVDDLNGVRKHLGVESIDILGHSWGALVAMHYALRHPNRTAHMVLLNSAPASHADLLLMREERLRRCAAHEEQLREILPGFARGDPEAVARYYRIDFGTTFKRQEDLARLNLAWTGNAIKAGRLIESHLAQGLIWSEGYTLLPALAAVRTPTLVIHGDFDFIPVECAGRIAEAIPGARLEVLRDSGHFSYIDAAEQVGRELDGFF